MSTASQIKRDLRGPPLRALLSVLRSPYHEERLFAVLSLADRYARGGDDDKKKVYDAYLGNLACVNNWDLVDSSAHVIVGPYLYAIEKFPEARRKAYLRGRVQ